MSHFPLKIWKISYVNWLNFVYCLKSSIMSTVGVFSTVGGYHPLKFEYRGDIMIHVGDIMSTVGGVQYRGVLK